MLLLFQNVRVHWVFQGNLKSVYVCIFVCIPCCPQTKQTCDLFFFFFFFDVTHPLRSTVKCYWLCSMISTVWSGYGLFTCHLSIYHRGWQTHPTYLAQFVTETDVYLPHQVLFEHGLVLTCNHVSSYVACAHVKIECVCVCLNKCWAYTLLFYDWQHGWGTAEVWMYHLSLLLIKCVGHRADFSSQPPSGSRTTEPGALFSPQTSQHPENLLTRLQTTWKWLFYDHYQAIVIPLCDFLWFCQL